VDVKILKTPEFVYLVSQFAGMSCNLCCRSGFSFDVTGGQGDETTKYIDLMSKLYARARKFAKDTEIDLSHDLAA
jgi:hypothetical protein